MCHVWYQLYCFYCISKQSSPLLVRVNESDPNAMRLCQWYGRSFNVINICIANMLLLIFQENSLNIPTDVLIYFRSLLYKERESEIETQVAADWLLIAHVIDRLCFIVFLTTTFLTTTLLSITSFVGS